MGQQQMGRRQRRRRCRRQTRRRGSRGRGSRQWSARGDKRRRGRRATWGRAGRCAARRRGQRAWRGGKGRCERSCSQGDCGGCIGDGERRSDHFQPDRGEHTDWSEGEAARRVCARGKAPELAEEGASRLGVRGGGQLERAAPGPPFTAQAAPHQGTHPPCARRRFASTTDLRHRGDEYGQPEARRRQSVPPALAPTPRTHPDQTRTRAGSSSIPF
jgi:hypothetical protein